uniref:TypA/BipA C-terminal domain-containing protein n=1 Tax=Chenopodium quinoa TaxID=63459 RepID=A0A803M6K3_CHEQI
MAVDRIAVGGLATQNIIWYLLVVVGGDGAVAEVVVGGDGAVGGGRGCGGVGSGGVSMGYGAITAHSLMGLEARGILFVTPGMETYDGMIIGEHSRDSDLDVNPARCKELNNIRAASKDENVKLSPPRLITLEEAIGYVQADELIEVTPKSIRWRMGLDLVDVPLSGPKFTWTNNRIDSDPIFERLDKVYASSAWFPDYPDTKVLHQPILFSDHTAIILSDTVESGYVKHPYRVENWCLSAYELLAWCVSHKKVWGTNWKTLVSEFQQASSVLSSRIDGCLFITTKDEKVAEVEATYLF